MIQPAHGTSRQLQLGDEEQIDERLARRAHELEGRLAKFGTAGIQKPKDLLEFVNNRSPCLGSRICPTARSTG